MLAVTRVCIRVAIVVPPFFADGAGTICRSYGSCLSVKPRGWSRIILIDRARVESSVSLSALRCDVQHDVDEVIHVDGVLLNSPE